MHAPVDIWSDLLRDIMPQQAALKKAANPLSLFRNKRLNIAEVIRKYFYVLQALPESEFELAVRDLYWAALLEQSRSKSPIPPIDAESATLFEADLSGLTLKGANFKYADFQYANLTDSSLINADLSGCKLQGADLVRAKLNNASFDHANLQDASLVDAKLRNANLSGADLQGASLIRADLRGAKCVGANLAFADLSYADLEGADLSNVTSNALTIWPKRYQKEANEEVKLLKGPSVASEQEVNALLQEEIKKNVPRVSSFNIERAVSYILKNIIELETGITHGGIATLRSGRILRFRSAYRTHRATSVRSRRGAHDTNRDVIIRFVKKNKTDRLVHYDRSIKRRLLKQVIGVSSNQAIHIVNVAARVVSRYEVRLITKPKLPSKKKNKQSSLETYNSF